MKLWAPHEGEDPHLLSEKGVEVWAPHPVYPQVFVSNLGSVERHDGPAPRYVVSGTGYVKVTITAKIRPYVHHLVLEAFRGFRPGVSARRHSQDRSDNRLCNLYWASTPGRLTRGKKEMVLDLLSRGVEQSVVARHTGLSPSHVHYYAKKLKTEG